MPPQKTKQQELQQQRVLQEQQKREQQQRIAKEEQKKYGAQNLPTGLVLILTPFYVTEAYQCPDPRNLTREFVVRYFKKQGLEENFREVDVDMLVQFHLFNLSYSLRKLKLDELNSCVLINILWGVLMNNDPRYQKIQKPDDNMKVNEFDALRLQQVRNSQKQLQNDKDYFKSIIGDHSVDKEPLQVKFFTSDQLVPIFKYFNSSYCNHFSLFEFFAKNQRRSVDVSELVVVDQPQEIPPLRFAKEIIVKDQFEEKLNEKLEEEERRRLELEQENNMRLSHMTKNEEDEEEPLDPVSLEIIRQKVEQYELKLQQQLEDRKQVLDQKVQDLMPKKGGKK